jgi:hypothetical protein
MPAAPVLGAIVDFTNGPAFISNSLILDDSTYGVLGFGQLQDQAVNIVDISNIIVTAQIRRGRNRILAQFEAGTASVTIYDENGDWNPENVSSPYYGDLKPLRKIQIYADYNSTRYYLFSGFITDYDTQFALGVDEVSKVVLKCVDGFRLFQNAQIASITGAGVQLSGARVNAILDEISFPTALRDIATGETTLQADPGTTRATIDALRTVEQSEFGGLFMDAEGRVTFIDRFSLTEALASPQYIFSDQGTDIPYINAVTKFDDSLIVNDVTVTRLGGSAQNVFDQTSIDTYFKRSGVRSDILVQTDSEALSQAQALLATRKDTETRIDSIQLNINDGDDVALCEAGLLIDLLDCVQITKEMPGATLIQRTLLVQGINHDLSNRRMTTTLFTGEALIDGFILNSQTEGVLDEDALSY